MTIVKQSICALLTTGLLVQFSACSTSPAMIQYNDFDKQVQLKPDAVSGTAMGVVKGDKGGAIWNDCTEKASDSMREMIAQAKAKGANAIGNIKWFASGDSSPSCKKGWGYLAVWPFILTPLFMSTEVSGQAYKVRGMAQQNGLILLPTTASEEESLVRRLVAGG